MSKMPWQGWILFLLLFGVCGAWTWLTPTNPDELVGRRIELVNVIQSYGTYILAGLAVAFFMIVKPFKAR